MHHVGKYSLSFNLLNLLTLESNLVELNVHGYTTQRRSNKTQNHQDTNL